MLKRLIAMGLLTVAMGGLGAACGDSGEGDSCSSDNDCKGDRICEGGECVSPGSTDSSNDSSNTPNNAPTSNSPNNAPTSNTPNNAPTSNTPNNAPTSNAPNNSSGGIGDDCFSDSDCDSDYCRRDKCAEHDFGNTCQGPDDCAHGACLVRDDGDIAGYCSATCESFSDCPSFWDCEELNNAAGTYCIQD